MYLDPGFGSMIIQLIVASVATGGAMFAIIRGKLAAKLGKRGAEDISDNATESTAPNKEA